MDWEEIQCRWSARLCIKGLFPCLAHVEVPNGVEALSNWGHCLNIKWRAKAVEAKERYLKGLAEIPEGQEVRWRGWFVNSFIMKPLRCPTNFEKLRVYLKKNNYMAVLRQGDEVLMLADHQEVADICGRQGQADHTQQLCCILLSKDSKQATGSISRSNPFDWIHSTTALDTEFKQEAPASSKLNPSELRLAFQRQQESSTNRSCSTQRERVPEVKSIKSPNNRSRFSDFIKERLQSSPSGGDRMQRKRQRLYSSSSSDSDRIPFSERLKPLTQQLAEQAYPRKGSKTHSSGKHQSGNHCRSDSDKEYLERNQRFLKTFEDKSSREPSQSKQLKEDIHRMREKRKEKHKKENISSSRGSSPGEKIIKQSPSLAQRSEKSSSKHGSVEHVRKTSNIFDTFGDKMRSTVASEIRSLKKNLSPTNRSKKTSKHNNSASTSEGKHSLESDKKKVNYSKVREHSAKDATCPTASHGEERISSKTEAEKTHSKKTKEHRHSSDKLVESKAGANSDSSRLKISCVPESREHKHKDKHSKHRSGSHSDKSRVKISVKPQDDDCESKETNSTVEKATLKIKAKEHTDGVGLPSKHKNGSQMDETKMPITIDLTDNHGEHKTNSHQVKVKVKVNVAHEKGHDYGVGHKDRHNKHKTSSLEEKTKTPTKANLPDHRGEHKTNSLQEKLKLKVDVPHEKEHKEESRHKDRHCDHNTSSQVDKTKVKDKDGVWRYDNHNEHKTGSETKKIKLNREAEKSPIPKKKQKKLSHTKGFSNLHSDSQKVLSSMEIGVSKSAVKQLGKIPKKPRPPEEEDRPTSLKKHAAEKRTDNPVVPDKEANFLGRTSKKTKCSEDIPSQRESHKKKRLETDSVVSTTSEKEFSSVSVESSLIDRFTPSKSTQNSPAKVPPNFTPKSSAFSPKDLSPKLINLVHKICSPVVVKLYKLDEAKITKSKKELELGETGSDKSMRARGEQTLHKQSDKRLSDSQKGRLGTETSTAAEEDVDFNFTSRLGGFGNDMMSERGDDLEVIERTDSDSIEGMAFPSSQSIQRMIRENIGDLPLGPRGRKPNGPSVKTREPDTDTWLSSVLSQGKGNVIPGLGDLEEIGKSSELAWAGKKSNRSVIKTSTGLKVCALDVELSSGKDDKTLGLEETVKAALHSTGVCSHLMPERDLLITRVVGCVLHQPATDGRPRKVTKLESTCKYFGYRIQIFQTASKKTRALVNETPEADKVTSELVVLEIPTVDKVTSELMNIINSKAVQPLVVEDSELVDESGQALTERRQAEKVVDNSKKKAELTGVPRLEARSETEIPIKKSMSNLDLITERIQAENVIDNSKRRDELPGVPRPEARNDTEIAVKKSMSTLDMVNERKQAEKVVDHSKKDEHDGVPRQDARSETVIGSQRSASTSLDIKKSSSTLDIKKSRITLDMINDNNQHDLKCMAGETVEKDSGDRRHVKVENKTVADRSVKVSNSSEKLKVETAWRSLEGKENVISSTQSTIASKDRLRHVSGASREGSVERRRSGTADKGSRSSSPQVFTSSQTSDKSTKSQESDKSVPIGKRLEKLAKSLTSEGTRVEKRQARQYHPYKKDNRPAVTNKKATWSFDVAYQDMNELLQNLTENQFSNLGQACADVHEWRKSTGKRTNWKSAKGARGRFAGFKFSRAPVPRHIPTTLSDSDEGEDEDIEEAAVVPEAIPDLEERGRRADLVEEFFMGGADSEDAENFSTEKCIYSSDKIEENSDRRVVVRTENTEGKPESSTTNEPAGEATTKYSGSSIVKTSQSSRELASNSRGTDYVLETDSKETVKTSKSQYASLHMQDSTNVVNDSRTVRKNEDVRKCVKSDKVKPITFIKIEMSKPDSAHTSDREKDATSLNSTEPTRVSGDMVKEEPVMSSLNAQESSPVKDLSGNKCELQEAEDVREEDSGNGDRAVAVKGEQISPAKTDSEGLSSANIPNAFTEERYESKQLGTDDRTELLKPQKDQSDRKDGSRKHQESCSESETSLPVNDETGKASPLEAANESNQLQRKSCIFSSESEEYLDWTDEETALDKDAGESAAGKFIVLDACGETDAGEMTIQNCFTDDFTTSEDDLGESTLNQTLLANEQGAESATENVDHESLDKTLVNNEQGADSATENINHESLEKESLRIVSKGQNDENNNNDDSVHTESRKPDKEELAKSTEEDTEDEDTCYVITDKLDEEDESSESDKQSHESYVELKEKENYMRKSDDLGNSSNSGQVQKLKIIPESAEEVGNSEVSSSATEISARVSENLTVKEDRESTASSGKGSTERGADLKWKKAKPKVQELAYKSDRLMSCHSNKPETLRSACSRPVSISSITSTSTAATISSSSCTVSASQTVSSATSRLEVCKSVSSQSVSPSVTHNKQTMCRQSQSSCSSRKTVPDDTLFAKSNMSQSTCSKSINPAVSQTQQTVSRTQLKESQNQQRPNTAPQSSNSRNVFTSNSTSTASHSSCLKTVHSPILHSREKLKTASKSSNLGKPTAGSSEVKSENLPITSQSKEVEPTSAQSPDLKSIDLPVTQYKKEFQAYSTPISSSQSQAYSASSQAYSTPGSSSQSQAYSASSQAHSTLGSSAPSQAYSASSQAYSTPGSSAQFQAYSTPGSSASSQAYSTPPQAYSTPSQAYSTPPEAYSTPSQAYSTPSQAYSTPSQAYSTPSQAYSTPSQAYSTPGSSAPSQISQVTDLAGYSLSYQQPATVDTSHYQQVYTPSTSYVQQDVQCPPPFSPAGFRAPFQRPIYHSQQVYNPSLSTQSQWQGSCAVFPPALSGPSVRFPPDYYQNASQQASNPWTNSGQSNFSSSQFNRMPPNTSGLPNQRFPVLGNWGRGSQYGHYNSPAMSPLQRHSSLLPVSPMRRNSPLLNPDSSPGSDFESYSASYFSYYAMLNANNIMPLYLPSVRPSPPSQIVAFSNTSGAAVSSRQVSEMLSSQAGQDQEQPTIPYKTRPALLDRPRTIGEHTRCISPPTFGSEEERLENSGKYVKAEHSELTNNFAEAVPESLDRKVQQSVEISDIKPESLDTKARGSAEMSDSKPHNIDKKTQELLEISNIKLESLGGKIQETVEISCTRPESLDRKTGESAEISHAVDESIDKIQNDAIITVSSVNSDSIGNPNIKEPPEKANVILKASFDLSENLCESKNPKTINTNKNKALEQVKETSNLKSGFTEKPDSCKGLDAISDKTCNSVVEKARDESKSTCQSLPSGLTLEGYLSDGCSSIVRPETIDSSPKDVSKLIKEKAVGRNISGAEQQKVELDHAREASDYKDSRNGVSLENAVKTSLVNSDSSDLERKGASTKKFSEIQTKKEVDLEQIDAKDQHTVMDRLTTDNVPKEVEEVLKEDDASAPDSNIKTCKQTTHTGKCLADDDTQNASAAEADTREPVTKMNSSFSTELSDFYKEIAEIEATEDTSKESSAASQETIPNESRENSQIKKLEEGIYKTESSPSSNTEVLSQDSYSHLVEKLDMIRNELAEIENMKDSSNGTTDQESSNSFDTGNDIEGKMCKSSKNQSLKSNVNEQEKDIRNKVEIDTSTGKKDVGESSVPVHKQTKSLSLISSVYQNEDSNSNDSAGSVDKTTVSFQGLINKVSEQGTSITADSGKKCVDASVESIIQNCKWTSKAGSLDARGTDEDHPSDDGSDTGSDKTLCDDNADPKLNSSVTERILDNSLVSYACSVQSSPESSEHNGNQKNKLESRNLETAEEDSRWTRNRGFSDLHSRGIVCYQKNTTAVDEHVNTDAAYDDKVREGESGHGKSLPPGTKKASQKRSNQRSYDDEARTKGQSTAYREGSADSDSKYRYTKAWLNLSYTQEDIDSVSSTDRNGKRMMEAFVEAGGRGLGDWTNSSYYTNKAYSGFKSGDNSSSKESEEPEKNACSKDDNRKLRVNEQPYTQHRRKKERSTDRHRLRSKQRSSSRQRSRSRESSASVTSDGGMNNSYRKYHNRRFRESPERGRTRHASQSGSDHSQRYTGKSDKAHTMRNPYLKSNAPESRSVERRRHYSSSSDSVGTGKSSLQSKSDSSNHHQDKQSKSSDFRTFSSPVENTDGNKKTHVSRFRSSSRESFREHSNADQRDKSRYMRSESSHRADSFRKERFSPGQSSPDQSRGSRSPSNGLTQFHHRSSSQESESSKSSWRTYERVVRISRASDRSIVSSRQRSQSPADSSPNRRVSRSPDSSIADIRTSRSGSNDSPRRHGSRESSLSVMDSYRHRSISSSYSDDEIRHGSTSNDSEYNENEGKSCSTLQNDPEKSDPDGQSRIVFKNVCTHKHRQYRVKGKHFAQTKEKKVGSIIMYPSTPRSPHVSGAGSEVRYNTQGSKFREELSSERSKQSEKVTQLSDSENSRNRDEPPARGPRLQETNKVVKKIYLQPSVLFNITSDELGELLDGLKLCSGTQEVWKLVATTSQMSQLALMYWDPKAEMLRSSAMVEVIDDQGVTHTEDWALLELQGTSSTSDVFMIEDADQRYNTQSTIVGLKKCTLTDFLKNFLKPL